MGHRTFPKLDLEILVLKLYHLLDMRNIHKREDQARLVLENHELRRDLQGTGKTFGRLL